jgi:hypothetical protein
MVDRQSGSDRNRDRSGGHSSHEHRTSGSGRREGGGRHFSLEEREYRGSDGQIHHHTNTYMEQHRDERQHGRSGRSSGESSHRGHGGGSGSKHSGSRDNR